MRTAVAFGPIAMCNHSAPTPMLDFIVDCEGDATVTLSASARHPLPAKRS